MNILNVAMTEEQKEQIKELIEEHGVKLVEEVYKFYCHITDVINMFENYEGEFENEESFAIQLWESCYEIPEPFVHYIDYKSVARDLFIDSYVSFEVDYKTHVFRRA